MTRQFVALPRDIRAALLLLVATMLFSSVILATNPSDALLQSTIQIVHLYFAAAIYFLAVRANGGDPTAGIDWSGLLRWLGIGLAAIAAYTAWRFMLVPPASEVPGGEILWDFAVPGFISVRYLGNWLGAIAAALAVGQLFVDDNRRLGVHHLVLLAVLSFMFWTGTRAAVLGVLVAIAFSACALRRLPDLRSLIVGAAIAVAALALAVLFAFDHPVFQLVQFQDAASVSTFTAGRSGLWSATIEQWSRSPLLGWGTGSLLWDVHLGWKHTQPHNALLQFALDWGLVGLAAAVWLFARALGAAIASARCDAASVPILGMVFALLAMSMVDGALYYPRLITLVLIGLALLIAAGERRGRTIPA